MGDTNNSFTKQELRERIEGIEDRLDILFDVLCAFWSKVSVFTYDQNNMNTKFKDYEQKYIMPKKMK